MLKNGSSDFNTNDTVHHRQNRRSRSPEYAYTTKFRQQRIFEVDLKFAGPPMLPTRFHYAIGVDTQATIVELSVYRQKTIVKCCGIRWCVICECPKFGYALP